MYLHIGNNVIINDKNIVGIFDLDTSTIKKITRDFLKSAQINNKIINVCEDLPKSFILCDVCGESVIYISQISSASLKGRLNFNFFKEVFK